MNATTAGGNDGGGGRDAGRDGTDVSSVSDRYDTERAEGLQDRRSADSRHVHRKPSAPRSFTSIVLEYIVPPGFHRRGLAVEFGGRSQGLYCPNYHPWGQLKSK